MALELILNNAILLIVHMVSLEIISCGNCILVLFCFDFFFLTTCLLSASLDLDPLSPILLNGTVFQSCSLRNIFPDT